MVNGAKGINEYKILKWIDENFESGSVSMKMIDDTTAEITDCKGDKLSVCIVKGSVKVL